MRLLLRCVVMLLALATGAGAAVAPSPLHFKAVLIAGDWSAAAFLEPDDGKLSRPVLRGPDPSNGVRLLGDNLVRLIEPMLSSAGAYPDNLIHPKAYG